MSHLIIHKNIGNKNNMVHVFSGYNNDVTDEVRLQTFYQNLYGIERILIRSKWSKNDPYTNWEQIYPDYLNINLTQHGYVSFINGLIY